MQIVKIPGIGTKNVSVPGDLHLNKNPIIIDLVTSAVNLAVALMMYKVTIKGRR